VLTRNIYFLGIVLLGLYNNQHKVC